MLRALTIIGTCLVASNALAKSVIVCEPTEAGGSQVVMDLSARSDGESTLACISGDFVSDMTPCAPEGGWGMSFPTGSASLSGVTMRWQDLDEHFGGVASFRKTSTELRFAGGFADGSGVPEDDWTFTANRLDGTAALVNEGKTSAYACEAKEQLF
ncbi:MAG: hypothetical protein OXR62_10425 [Ahrensia sp.]|nr:hypothetical protein [Ahrensia sp.]